jgi:hypothetical protein
MTRLGAAKPCKSLRRKSSRIVDNDDVDLAGRRAFLPLHLRSSTASSGRPGSGGSARAPGGATRLIDIPNCIVSATTASFRSVEKRRLRATPVKTFTFELILWLKFIVNSYANF